MGWMVLTAHASDNLTIPNTFSSGATISSSQMNENFNRLIELLDNQSKTINNLETKLNTLISELFTHHPRIVTLNYTNGDRGNCTINNLNYVTDKNQCIEEVGTSNVYDENSEWNPRGCYLDSGGYYKFNASPIGTAEISDDKPQQICTNSNPSL